MSYTQLALLGAALAIALDLGLLRTNLLLSKAFWASYAIIVFFQLISNGILTGLPVVRYDPSGIIGWHLVYAPVEDLLFGFAMVVVTLSVWVWLGARGPLDAARPAPPRRDAPGRR